MPRRSRPPTPRASTVAWLLAVLLAPSLAAQTPVDPELFGSLDYRMVGPTRGGRVTAVAGHRAHPSTFYMGATGGGVWKTTDWGATWLPVSDGFFHTGSIGSIRVAPSEPDIVYVGTGSDGIRSNVIQGKGLYRSDDAGATWRRLGLENAGQIGAVVVHPSDPDVVYAAALGNPWGRNRERGVYRTRDGGDRWERVLFTSDSVGAIDLEMHPTDPDVLYAAMWRGERKPWTIVSGMPEAGLEDGIWRSTDGGDTWTYVTLGLPSGLIGKVDFAVTPAAPDRVWAVVETKEPDEGLYRSDDRGRTWRLISNHEPLMDRPFYYTNVDVDPTDADVIYVNATRFWRSTDGGRSWERRSTPHGDNHDMWINPDDPRVIVQGNDGGANVTRDGGETWSTQMNQPTAELYQVHVDDRVPYWLYAGQQDNSTLTVPSAPPAEGSVVGPEGWWKPVGGCETGPVVPKPGDPDVVYANCKGRFGRFSHVTGQEQRYYVGAVDMYGHNPRDLPFRFQRVVPIAVSPFDPEAVYHGSQYVHVTRNGGRDWERISPDLTAFRPERQVVSGRPITRDITGEEHYSALYDIEPSTLDPDEIWTGSNDGPVHVTRDGGRRWTEVTPPMPPEGRVQSIEVSPHVPGKAYVAAYRTLLGDFEPYAFRTDDWGESWTRLTTGSNGVPDDHPTRVLREDPDREGLLYLGTEFGMFVSFDDGARWQSLQLDLPVTPVTDLKVVDRDLVVSTMGRSFWILDDLTPLHEVEEAAASDVAHLVQPKDQVRFRQDGDVEDDPGPPVGPEYPPPGVNLDYYLAAETPDVRLEVLRGDDVVATFEATGAPDRTEEGQEMRAPLRRRVVGSRLDTRPGMHRVRWDLRVEGLGERGPLALPGSYSVRLTAGGEVQTRTFELLMDPRVVADGVTMADLEAQYRLQVRVAELAAEARATTDRIERALEGAEEGSGWREGLDVLRARLVDDDVGSYPQPMLNAQIEYLARMISGADQAPGADAYARTEQLEAELREIRTELERLERLIT